MRVLFLCFFALLAPVSRAQTNYIVLKGRSDPYMLLGPAAQAGTNGIFDVRAFGAIGDGKTKDTAAFQKALDACAAAANGGTVTVTSGVYLVGIIVIGSNTTLQLDGRASLLGSPDI